MTSLGDSLIETKIPVRSGRALAGPTSHEVLSGLNAYYRRALANDAGDELLKHIEQALFHVRAIHAEMCPRDECGS